MVYNIESEVPGSIAGVIEYWLKHDPLDLTDLEFRDFFHEFRLAHPRFIVGDKLDEFYQWFTQAQAQLSLRIILNPNTNGANIL